MEHSLHHKIKIVECVDPAAAPVTADAIGDIIDTAGFESLEYVIHAEGLNGAFTALLEDGDAANLSDAAAVPAAQTLGTLPVLSTGDSVARVGCISKKRYQRLTLTESSPNTAGTIGAIAILGHPKNAPTDEQTGA